MKKDMSRRELLHFGGIAAAAATAGALVGCSPNSKSETNTAGADITWDKEVDFVVVGTGTATFAAFAALDAGATSVLLLEKLSTFGGAAAFSGGAFWAPFNYVMKEQGLEDTREDAIGYVKLNAESQSTTAIIETYVDNATKFIDWTVARLGFQWGVITGAPLSGNTGDGHRMGLDVGADLGNMNNVYGCSATVRPDQIPEGEALLDGSFFLNDFFTVFDAPLRRAKPNAIVVNRAGERFGNESAPYAQFNRSFEGWNSDTFSYRNIPAYFIGDATFFQHYLLPGAANDAKVGDIPEGTIVANTLAEVAEKCGIDYEKLSATVARFNAHARDGIDPDFHRGTHHFDLQTGADFSGRSDLANPCLGPIETPPFYAFGYLPGMLETNGGLVVNEKAQVLNRAGAVIPGLFAVGCCASSVFGSGYPGAGSTVAAGAVFAWLGAQAAFA